VGISNSTVTKRIKIGWGFGGGGVFWGGCVWGGVVGCVNWLFGFCVGGFVFWGYLVLCWGLQRVVGIWVGEGVG